MFTVHIESGMSLSRHHFATEADARALCEALARATDVDRVELHEGCAAPGLTEPVESWGPKCEPVIISE